jgi:AraC-like DNA-binding protein
MAIAPKTIQETAVPSKPESHLLRQPHFYFVIALFIAVGGFWPSFFSKLTTTDRAHLIHGFSATLWMIVPIVQSWLISRRKFKLHRQLGWVTLSVLAPILVVSGLHMVQLMVLRYEQTHAIRLLKFTFLDLCAMTLFVTFLVLAIFRIRHGDRDGHARYMAGTVLFALEPALERVFVFYIPGVSGFAPALYFALITMEVILAVLLFFEWQRHRGRGGLARLMDWAQKEIQHPLSVEDLARQALMSPRTFARRFIQETGTTPHRWLTCQRVLNAQRMLEITDDSIDVIAERVGFGTAATLRLHFRKLLDTSPLAYRRRFSTRHSHGAEAEN